MSKDSRLTKLGYIIFFANNYTKLLKGVLSIFLIVIFFFFTGGVMKMTLYLKTLLYEDMETVINTVIIQILILLALLEIIRIILAYFQEGRVRVIFVVDTVFIIVSSEVLSFWFKHGPSFQVIYIVALLFSLVIVRAVTIKFSAKKLEESFAKDAGREVMQL